MWAWGLAAVGAVAAILAMMRYERSQQEQIEELLRAALLEFRAASSEADRPENAGSGAD